jgi:aryl-alcohol dehydrogenase-like predicted oxidoreductase
MDDEEQPARHGSALAADRRRRWNSMANVALLRLPPTGSAVSGRPACPAAASCVQKQQRGSGGASACDDLIMEHRHLGRTGVSVSRFCLGAMMFGAWGNPDHDESIRIIHRALDAGINFIDTADVYGQGESEEIVGKALAGGRRDNVFLATKFHGAMGEDPNQQGNSRRWIIPAVEDSLRRLGTDWIDLYQVHRPDPSTDIDETLGALTDLVHAGKVRYIGHSTFPASRIVEAQWAARDRGLQRFVTEQPPYSMLVRAAEADVLPTCLRHGMGVMSYSPLTGGWLSGRWRKETGPQSSSRAARLPERFDLANPYNQRKLDAVEELAQLADETGLTFIQLAIAFVLNHPAITSALIGPRTMEQLESQLAAADITLDDAVLDRIDEIVPAGITINPADNSFANPALEPTARRRA